MRDLALQIAGVLAILVAIGHGVPLIVAPTFGSQAARQWVIVVAVVVYAYAAVGNAVATRGRHIGWCVMTAVVALALMGH